MQHRDTKEERIRLKPKVAPHPKNSAAMFPDEIRGCHRPNNITKACPAVGLRHVRGALRQGVDHGVSLVERFFPSCETPDCIRRGKFSCGVDEPAGGSVEGGHRWSADVVRAPGEPFSCIVHNVGEEVPIGVAEDARVVEHDGILLKRAELLRVLECAVNAAPAQQGVVGVPAAEGKGVDRIRRSTCRSGDE